MEGQKVKFKLPEVNNLTSRQNEMTKVLVRAYLISSFNRTKNNFTGGDRTPLKTTSKDNNAKLIKPFFGLTKKRPKSSDKAQKKSLFRLNVLGTFRQKN